MDVKRLLQFVFLLLFMVAPVKAETPAKSIYQKISHYADKTHQYTLDNIEVQAESMWEPMEGFTPNFSISPDTHWLRVELYNPNSAPFSGYFSIKTPHQDYISLLTLNADGTRRMTHTGDRLNFNTRPVNHKHFQFPVSMAPKESLRLYFQLKSYDGLHELMPVALVGHEQWQQETFTESMLFGLYYGATAILIFYNLALFISTRDKRFGSYTLYLSAFSAWNITFTGYAFQFFWPDSPDWNNQFLAASTILAFWSFSLFGMHFMNLKESAPALFKLIAAINALLIIPMAMSLQGSYASTMSVTFAIISVLFFLLMATAGWLAWKNQATAKVFFAAWMILTLSILHYIGQIMGLLPSSPYSAYVINIGGIMEFFVLAVALAVHFNRKQLDSIAYQTKLAEQNTQKSEKLQIIIEQQTAKLDHAQNKLADIAVTDPLTGLLNRRYFSKVLEKELKRGVAEGEALSLVLIDIDNFKAFNDQYGHAAGDQALMNFSRLLKESFSSKDEQLFRVGGEEFAVLSRPRSRSHIQSRLAGISIRAEQGNINIPEYGANNPLKYSVGVALVGHTCSIPTTSGLFRLADDAIYAAKSSYRAEPVFREWSERKGLRA